MVGFGYTDFELFDEDDAPEPDGVSWENQNREKSPFDESVKDGARTSRFFYKTEIAEHMSALKSSDIGRDLAEFCENRKLDIHKGRDLPENTEALYLRPRGTGRKGELLFGHLLNSLLLGHEIRHAWQHLELPPELQSPDSAAGQVFLDRFIEADARAIEFGVALQTIYAMRSSHAYAYNLIAIFDQYQKDICEHRIDRLEEIAASPAELKMAMRRCFDYWISIGPAQKIYEKNTQKTLDLARTGKGLGKMFEFFSRGHDGLPVYTRDHLDPAYPQKLAGAIGNLGKTMGGNYLTETAGLDFNAPFYTRICNYRLERSVANINKHLLK